jgi:CheY-like chemotaxis protein
VTAVVASAEEAIEVASREPVALAIMDIRLSGQRDGVDAAIELSRIGGIRFIFATAHSDASVRKRAEEVKPLAWLQKPYSMASLVQTVRAALND